MRDFVEKKWRSFFQFRAGDRTSVWLWADRDNEWAYIEGGSSLVKHRPCWWSADWPNCLTCSSKGYLVLVGGLNTLKDVFGLNVTSHEHCCRTFVPRIKFHLMLWVTKRVIRECHRFAMSPVPMYWHRARSDPAHRFLLLMTWGIWCRKTQADVDSCFWHFQYLGRTPQS